MRQIPIETLDGYEFQKFVANLFKQLGFVNVELGPPTADGGIDISMEEKSTIGHMRFVVECKHHPEKAIGRPVVQKLHSAVMHTPTLDKGIIVTSGHFSSQAIRYAEEVGIELIDIEKLKELARKVGLSLEVKPSLSIDNCFPISEKAKVINKLHSFLQDDLIGFNKDFVKVEELGLRLVSSYMVDYTIDATFSTSAGTIHSINETSTIFLDGNSGNPINPTIIRPLLPLRYNISELKQENLKGVKLTEKGDFVKNHKEIKEGAKQALIRMYTKTASYYGANNVLYTKTCTPGKKDITLSDVKRVYLPLLCLVFSMSKNKYVVVATETPYKLNILPSNLIMIPESSGAKAYPNNCMICSKEMEHKKYVCNECGAIICSKDSSKCKTCEKVICKEHTISKRKFLVVSDKYCPQCAKSEGIIS